MGKFDRGPVFDRTIQEESIQINVGDIIIGFTGGVIETVNRENKELGSEGFYSLIGKYYQQEPSQIVNSLISELENYKGAAPQKDDITIIALKRIVNQ